MIRHRPRCWMLQGLVVVGTHLQQCVLSPAAFGVGHRVRPQLFLQQHSQRGCCLARLSTTCATG